MFGSAGTDDEQRLCACCAADRRRSWPPESEIVLAPSFGALPTRRRCGAAPLCQDEAVRPSAPPPRRAWKEVHAVAAPPRLDGVAARHRRASAPLASSDARRHRRAVRAGHVALHGYVPSGMTPEAYAAMKKKEEADRKKKQFGKGGARGFESRSMQSFVAGLEKGETKHLFPVNPAKVRTGEIALKDVPYMQRGGSWTNSDLTQKKEGLDEHGLRHERLQRRQGQGPEGQ